MKKNETLYNLSTNFEIVQNMLYDLISNEDCESEDYKETEKALTDTLECINASLEDKVDGYCTIIKKFKYEQNLLADEIKRYQKRKGAIDNAINRLKENLLYSLKTTGKTKVKTTFNTCYISKSGSRELVYKCEPEDLPAQFKKITVKPDTKLIKEYLKQNDTEETDFVRLGDRKESVCLR